MSNIGKSERTTQNRVIKLFRDELGYHFLGDKTDQYNSNIEESQLSACLLSAGYSSVLVSRAIDKLKPEANNPNRSLYDNNMAVYGMLRYGVDARVDASAVSENIKLINWDKPESNHFAIAE